MDLHKKIHDKYKNSIERRGRDIDNRPASPSVHQEKKPWTFKRVIAWGITLIIAGIATGIFLFFTAIAVLSIGLPSINNIGTQTALTTEIYDRNGILLHTIHGEENREYIPYEQISPHLINATIAVEDDQFWQHKGFDMTGIAAAALHETFGIGKKRGGSTITQQYVKNAFLSRERSMIRKIRELILAVRLEQSYDKKKILELYLNQIPYGNNAYGIQKASEMYFNKNASDLTVGESAILASIPQLPTYYNPYGTHKFATITKNFTPEELENRAIKTSADIQNDEYMAGLIGKDNKIDEKQKLYMPGRSDLVLRRMTEFNYISTEEKNRAWEEIQKIEFVPYKSLRKAPHFVQEIRDQLEQKYGKEIIERGGLKVYTTLDWKLQELAEKAIEKRGESNQKTYKASNAAALFADPKTGQILAMVGSRDFNNKEIDGMVNVTTSARQPGSSFKPIVYAQAFLRRYTPATVLYDTPLQLGENKPQNYDGTFRGPMSIRAALGQSRNIPAIKAYYLAGEKDPIIELSEKLGITTIDREHDYGYPLAIGAAEVKMIDMVTAYSTFANMGKRPVMTSILKIEDSTGKTIEEWDPESVKNWEEALDPEVAYLIDHILSDSTVKVSQNLVIPDHTVATKTGTSTNKTKSKGVAFPMDLWVMGYTPNIVGSVWVGNNRGEPMGGNADGSNVSAPIWKEIMLEYLKDKPDEQFVRPKGIKEVTISTLTGLLPSENTPTDKLRTELFASFAVPTEVESSYVKANIDIRNDLLANEFCPPEFVQSRMYQIHTDPIANEQWKTGLYQWVEGKGAESGLPPTTISPLCVQEQMQNAPVVSIFSPSAYQIIEGTTVDMVVKYKAPNGVKDVTYYFDDTPRLVRSSAPFEHGTIKIPKYATPGSTHTLRAVVRDVYGYSGQGSIQIKLAGDAPQEDTDGPPVAPSTPPAPPGANPQPTPSPQSSNPNDQALDTSGIPLFTLNPQ